MSLRQPLPTTPAVNHLQHARPGDVLRTAIPLAVHDPEAYLGTATAAYPANTPVRLVERLATATGTTRIWGDALVVTFPDSLRKVLLPAGVLLPDTSPRPSAYPEPARRRLLLVHERLTELLSSLPYDMHEPDNYGLAATVYGAVLDNSEGAHVCPETDLQREIVVRLSKDGTRRLDVNLADLLALARLASL